MNILDGIFSIDTLDRRAQRLAAALTSRFGSFDTALIVSRVNMYWLCGTIQDGMAVLRSDGSVRLFARKSYERAREESPLPQVLPMRSYRDMLGELPPDLGRVCVETEVMPLAMLERLKKYFSLGEVLSMDRVLVEQRAVKEPQELALIRESGRLHAQLLNEIVPSLLTEGMNEAELVAKIYAEMVRIGHHGVSRFSMFQMELMVGQAGFGTNSLYPTNFDGPGGMRGLHPAVPFVGDRSRTLERGDLVFVDVGFGYLGYHSDKTQVYSFGSPPSEQVLATHEACRQVLRRTLAALRPGTLASEAYAAGYKDLPSELSQHFMGYGKGAVKFLGHGVGLQIDEQPVIMAANEEPLREGMVIALEPKCGVEGVGMVGIEETYILTTDGPECITGGDRDILVV